MHVNGRSIVDEQGISASIDAVNGLRKRAESELNKLLRIYPDWSNDILHCHKRKTGSFYSIRKNVNGKLEEKYIYDKRMISVLYRMKYYRQIIKYSGQYSDNWQRKHSSKASLKLEKVLDGCNMQFAEEIPSDLLSNRICAKLWSENPYIRNMFAVEKCIFATKKGDKVRSKSEMFIADMLWDFGLPYRYESALELKNGKIIYPDFTIMDPKTGKIYYFEYFGMMDVEEYVASNIKRLKDYSENSIFIGCNLLAAFESSRVPFDPLAVRKILKNAFFAGASDPANQKVRNCD